MPCWPVSHRDGKYQVTDTDGILYPITMGRNPVEVLQPGWYPVGLQTGLRPFHLLELRNDAGAGLDAVWYLSEELDFVSHDARRFTPEQAAQLVSSLSPLLRDLHDQTLCAPRPVVAESSHAFDGINPAFVRDLIGLIVETALSAPELVAADRLERISSHYMANGVRLSASLLRHCLDVTIPGSVEDAPPETPAPPPSPFRAASPVDASLLEAHEHVVLPDGPIRHAYRFFDPGGELAFYLLFPREGAPALYVPAMNAVFITEQGLTGAQVMTILMSHYASHTDRVVQPQAEPQAGPPAAMPAPEPFTAASTPPGPVEPAGMPPANWWTRLFGLGNS